MEGTPGQSVQAKAAKQEKIKYDIFLVRFIAIGVIINSNANQ